LRPDVRRPICVNAHTDYYYYYFYGTRLYKRHVLRHPAGPKQRDTKSVFGNIQSDMNVTFSNFKGIPYNNSKYFVMLWIRYTPVTCIIIKLLNFFPINALAT